MSGWVGRNKVGGKGGVEELGVWFSGGWKGMEGFWLKFLRL